MRIVGLGDSLTGCTLNSDGVTWSDDLGNSCTPNATFAGSIPQCVAYNGDGSCAAAAPPVSVGSSSTTGGVSLTTAATTASSAGGTDMTGILILALLALFWMSGGGANGYR
jgi:hypothetical protein